MNDNLAEIKKEFRKTIKEKLNQLKDNEDYKTYCKNKICSIFSKSSLFKNSDIIISFLSLNTEISTDNIINLCFDNKKIVYVPRINDDNKTMTFFQLDKNIDIQQQTQKNKYNILEPLTSLPVLEKKQITKNTVIFIPGLAFSIDGSRLGRGKGFYDIFLSSLTTGIKTGLCYSLQILNNIPSEKHDIKVEYLLTEKNLLLCKKDI
jgi:5-formyltetrahydrofolate cyclo-ligase